MVTIFITTQNAEAQTRIVSFFAELEEVLDQLSYISQLGEVVTQAYVVDQKQRLDLPLQIFDGQSFSAPIRELKHQWQAILSKPLTALSVRTRSYIELNTIYLVNLENQKQTMERSLIHAQRLLDWSREDMKQGGERLLGHYEALISYYELQLTRIAQQLEATESRLKVLNALLVP